MADGQWAALFPGQGSQYVGMGRAVAEFSRAARDVFQEADDALGYPLSAVIWDGPEERLRLTEVQQPAILTVSVAVWRALDFTSMPSAAVGLSLGEYSALVASGLMPFRDAVRVVEVRGRAMQQAVPAGQGGMTAVLGLPAEEVEALCRAVAAHGHVEAANYNAPGQVVVSGAVSALDALETACREAGARTVRLSVSAPFHSRLLTPAEEPLRQALQSVRWGTGRFPVVANVDTYPVRTADEAIPRLIAQVSKPVRFEQSIRTLVAAGVTRFVEIGPGRSLAALVRKIERGVRVVSVEAPDSFSAGLELA
jgi:[acyl-carrier-protein] S-malonyltransferase